MDLATVWFVAVAALFIGYFVLEGFDFGVGMLVGGLARDDRERRVLINTIGPVWDGNEVWIITAGGALFAAFPEWYATLFSGFYLPLLLILVALIGRGVAFEYRGKRNDPTWRRRWDAVIIGGSLLPSLLWGVAFANLVRGVPIDASGEYVGGLTDLLSPYALLGGAVTLTLFLVHGAVFVALKTDGDIRHRARRLAGRLGPVAAVLAVGFLTWTVVGVRGSVAAVAAAAVAAATLLAGLGGLKTGREGWAFTGTAVAIAAAVATLFRAMYPNVMPSTIDPAYSLTVQNASSTPYTLQIMTWLAAFALPVVIAYQAWTYWVFRKRLTVAHIPADEPQRVGASR